MQLLKIYAQELIRWKTSDEDPIAVLGSLIFEKQDIIPEHLIPAIALLLQKRYELNREIAIARVQGKEPPCSEDDMNGLNWLIRKLQSALKAATTIHVSHYGSSRIVGYEASGQAWHRLDCYTPLDPKSEGGTDRVFAVSDEDISPLHSSYMGPNTYDSRCPSCYLNHAHTVDEHNLHTEKP